MLHYLHPTKKNLAEDISKKGMELVQNKHNWTARIEHFLADLIALSEKSENNSDKTA
jgi:hypothetical protein